MATSLWYLTGAVRMVRHSAPSNYKSLATQLIWARQYATSVTASLQAVCMQWVRALAQGYSYPIWASVVPPAMWLLLPACHPSSAVRAGLRVVLAGPSTGSSSSIRRSALAGTVKWSTSNTLYHCIINTRPHKLWNLQAQQNDNKTKIHNAKKSNMCLHFSGKGKGGLGWSELQFISKEFSWC